MEAIRQLEHRERQTDGRTDRVGGALCKVELSLPQPVDSLVAERDSGVMLSGQTITSETVSTTTTTQITKVCQLTPTCHSDRCGLREVKGQARVNSGPVLWRWDDMNSQSAAAVPPCWHCFQWLQEGSVYLQPRILSGVILIYVMNHDVNLNYQQWLKTILKNNHHFISIDLSLLKLLLEVHCCHPQRPDQLSRYNAILLYNNLLVSHFYIMVFML